MHLSKMASKAGICLVLEPVIFTSFCHQFQSGTSFKCYWRLCILAFSWFTFFKTAVKTVKKNEQCNSKFKESLYFGF